MTDTEFERLVLVSYSYCFPQRVELFVRERCCSRDDFIVTELSSNEQWFKLRGRPLTGPENTRKLVDGDGKVLARFKAPPVAVPKRVVGQGPGYSFEVRPHLHKREAQ